MPEVKQRSDYSCGNAAALSILRYWRWSDFAEVGERQLYAPLETTEQGGTEPEPMAQFFRRCGLDAQYRWGDVAVTELERAVDAREPPVVDLQAWRDDERRPWRETWDSGHYVILVGYDAERLFFFDPSVLAKGEYVYFPRDELEERWHDTTGTADTKVEHMAIFVRGGRPTWAPRNGVARAATRMR